MTVLVVENSLCSRKLLRYTFVHFGCTIVVARDCDEGVAMGHSIAGMIIEKLLRAAFH